MIAGGALKSRTVSACKGVDDWSHARFYGASALTNLRMGYKLSRRTQLALDVYNLFDRQVNDIEYWYDSQLASEGAAVDDRHIHPTEPRSRRLTISHRF